MISDLNGEIRTTRFIQTVTACGLYKEHATCITRTCHFSENNYPWTPLSVDQTVLGGTLRVQWYE